MPVNIYGGAVRGEIFPEALKSGFAVGSAFRQRRIDEAAMKEAYGTKSVVGAQAQQLIEERTRKDTNMLIGLLTSQSEEVKQLGVKLWNKHPILGAEPIKYHPKVNVFTTKDMLIESYQDPESGEMKYNMYPLASPEKKFTAGEIISGVKKLKQSGMTVKYEATFVGNDEDGDAMFDDVKVNVSEKEGPAPEDRDKALKAKVDTLKSQQEGIKKEMSAILGPIETANSMAMLFAMSYAETREERDRLIEKFAVTNTVERLSPENKRKILQLYAALGEVTSQLIQTNPEAFRKMKEEETRQTEELEQQEVFDADANEAYLAIDQLLKEGKKKEAEKVRELFKADHKGKELPPRK